MKIAVICVVKNAELRISEWIAYHIAIGFDTVILLDNASTDDTANEARKFSAKYDVRLINWPMTGYTYQCNGYEYALWKFRNEFEWCACIDVDEFIDPPEGKTLLSILPDDQKVAGLVMPWAIFGSSGHTQRPEGLVIESYTRRAPNDFNINTHFKSIVRPDKVKFALNAHAFDVDGTYVDTFGNEISAINGVTEYCLDFSGGKINHYFVQSKACWDEKLARGYNDGTRRSIDEFDFYDRNEVEDISAKSKSGIIMTIIDSLKT